MESLQSIIDRFVCSKETRYGNPDTMRITNNDVVEWENALFDYTPATQTALIE